MWPSAGDRAAAVNAWVPTASQFVTYVSGGPPDRPWAAALEIAPAGRTTALTSRTEATNRIRLTCIPLAVDRTTLGHARADVDTER